MNALATPLSELLVTPVTLPSLPHEWSTPPRFDDCGCEEGNPLWSPSCVQAAIAAAVEPFREVLEHWNEEKRLDSERLTPVTLDQVLEQVTALVKIARADGVRDGADLYLADMTLALAGVLGQDESDEVPA